MKKSILFVLYSIVLAVFVALLSSGITALTIENRKIKKGDKVIVSQEEYALLQKYKKIDTVRGWIDDYYYLEEDTDALIDGAVKGMVSSLNDPYSYYYSAEQQADKDEKSSGVYTGLGIIVQKKADDPYPVVLRVYKDSPANKAGILRGDVLVAIDGQDLAEVEDYKPLLNKETDDKIVLSLKRDGVVGEYALTRQAINANRVEYEIRDDNIGYVYIADFEGNVVEEFDSAVLELKKSKIKGLIIDLRSNPGGYVDYACQIADHFLPKGIVTYTVTKEGDRKDYLSDAYCWDIPLCVLVNGSTASASEIFCGAIQSMGKGVIIGTQTYGKGVVTLTHRYKEDNSAVTLTYANYYTPSGQSIHGKGITPDIVCEPAEEEKDMHFLLYKIDNQYKQALAKLKEMIAAK